MGSPRIAKGTAFIAAHISHIYWVASYRLGLPVAVRDRTGFFPIYHLMISTAPKRGRAFGNPRAAGSKHVA